MSIPRIENPPLPLGSLGETPRCCHWHPLAHIWKPIAHAQACLILIGNGFLALISSTCMFVYFLGRG
jgi:hypothetical protein